MRLRGPGAVGSAMGCLALAGVAAGQPATCFVEVSLEPEHAYVGQQVRYRARVLMRDDVESIEWSRPLTFPRTRTEVLPGETRGGRVEREGAVYYIRDELRALFPERAGALALEAPDLRCRTGAVDVPTAVPAAVLTVSDPPEDGRPEGFGGLIGPVLPHLTLTPREVRLGESVRAALLLRGAGNLWVLGAAFPAEVEGAELFVQRPELVLERGRALMLRRHFVMDLVPRVTGTLELPELVIPYFDPERGAYAAAVVDAQRVIVHPRAAGGAPPPVERPAAPSRPSEGGGRAVWLGVGAGMLLLGLASWWVLSRGSRAPDFAIDAAEEDAAAQARSLRAALSRHVSDAAVLTPEELLARGDLSPAVETAAHCLAALERARFDPDAPAPEPGVVRRAIAAL